MTDDTTIPKTTVLPPTELSLEQRNEQASAVAERVADNAASIDKMDIMAGLVNVFNVAILKQAGRKQWNAADAYLFTQALSAVDQIGVYDPVPQTQERDDEAEHDRIESDIRDAVQSTKRQGFIDDARIPRVVSG